MKKINYTKNPPLFALIGSIVGFVIFFMIIVRFRPRFILSIISAPLLPICEFILRCTGEACFECGLVPVIVLALIGALIGHYVGLYFDKK